MNDEEIGSVGLKRLRNSLKFGDIVVNHWASDRNPHKTGVFVKFNERSILVTDMKGVFWELIFDSRSRIEVAGTIIASKNTSQLIDPQEPEPENNFTNGLTD